MWNRQGLLKLFPQFGYFHVKISCLLWLVPFFTLQWSCGPLTCIITSIPVQVIISGLWAPSCSVGLPYVFKMLSCIRIFFRDLRQEHEQNWTVVLPKGRWILFWSQLTSRWYCKIINTRALRWSQDQISLCGGFFSLLFFIMLCVNLSFQSWTYFLQLTKAPHVWLLSNEENMHRQVCSSSYD